MEKPDEAQQEALPVAVKPASGKYGDALVDFESRYAGVFFTISLRLSVVFVKSRFLASKQPHSISLGPGEHLEKLLLQMKRFLLHQSRATPCPLHLSAQRPEMAQAGSWPGGEAALENGWVCGEVNAATESSSESHRCFQQAI